AAAARVAELDDLDLAARAQRVVRQLVTVAAVVPRAAGDQEPAFPGPAFEHGAPRRLARAHHERPRVAGVGDPARFQFTQGVGRVKAVRGRHARGFYTWTTRGPVPRPRHHARPRRRRVRPGCPRPPDPPARPPRRPPALRPRPHRPG